MNRSSLHCLPATLVSEISNHAPTINYEDGEVIHVRGDAKPGLSIVKSGAVKVGNYDLDGKYCLTRVLSPNETFGEFTLFAHLPRTHNAEALGETEVLQLDKTMFEQCCNQFPNLKDLLMASLAIKLHDSLEILDDVRRLPLPVRTAKTLYSLAQQRDSARIVIKQNDLAELLGVTVLSVHHALKKLSGMKLIELGYGAISITSMTEFEQWLRDSSSILSIEH